MKYQFNGREMLQKNCLFVFLNSGADFSTNLPDSCQSMLQFLLHITAVHGQLIGLGGSSILCR